MQNQPGFLSGMEIPSAKFGQLALAAMSYHLVDNML